MINTIWDYTKMMLIEPMNKLVASLFEGAWYKVLLAFLAYVIGFIYENSVAYNVLLYFILVDTFTGVWAAITRQEKLSSRRFRFSVVKLLLYSLLISVFHQLEFVSAVFAALKLDSLVLAYLAITELISIMENITTVTHIKYPNSITQKLSAIVGIDGKEENNDITKKTYNK